MLAITIVGILLGVVSGVIVRSSFSVLVYFFVAGFATLWFHARIGVGITDLHLHQKLKDGILWIWMWTPLSIFAYCVIQGIHFDYYRAITLSVSSFGLLIATLFTWETLMRAEGGR